MKLSERVFQWLIDWNENVNSPRGRELWKLSAEVAILEAKLTAIECGDCGLTMLECKCDDVD